MASNQKQTSLLRFGFQDAVNPYLLPVFGPANLPVYGPQPKPQRPKKANFIFLQPSTAADLYLKHQKYYLQCRPPLKIFD
jgi:hypothetical protein